MDRPARNDEDLAREHRSDDPLGPAEQPEGRRADARNPSASHMDRPLVGRSGQQDEKSTHGTEDGNGSNETRDD
jgi:hypothetical protein